MLGFVGVKLIVEALRHDGVDWAPEIPILASLAMIVDTLVFTAVASLIAARRRDRNEESAPRRGV